MRALLKPLRTLAVLSAITLSACEPIAPPAETGTLDVLVRNTPSTYFTTPEGETAGFEHDVLMAFAASQGWRVAWHEVKSPNVLFDKLERGRAHLGVAALPRQVVRDRHLMIGPTLMETPVHVVVRSETAWVRSPAQLGGKRLALVVGAGHTPMLQRLKRKYPKLSWAGLENVWPEELLAALDAGHYDAVVINGMDFDPLRTIYPNLQVAFDLRDQQSIVWALPTSTPLTMRNALARFIEAARRDGSLATIRERYFGHVRRLSNADMIGLLERRPARLPELRAYFQEAQVLTGIDWRLLAAIGYQESHWDAFATSRTGVRGLMMLTGQTADRMGVTNRLDPRQSILGGARYLALMRDSLPTRIPEPDRTWLALAAYNQGQGHMEDARRIAQARGGNPDRWVDVKAALPYLGRGGYAHVTRYGYARGAEALIFAENIRNYHDMLLRLEPAYAPVLGLDAVQAAAASKLRHGLI